MNRRDKQRLDERRREANAPKHHHDSGDTSKSLMDNYFESQKVIQSFLTPNNEVKITKSFKIPKKQPVSAEAGRGGKFGNDISGLNSNKIEENDRSPIIPSRRNDRNPRQDWNNQNKRFTTGRGQNDQITPKKDFFDRKKGSNGVDIDVKGKRNDQESKSILDRIVSSRKREPNQIEVVSPIKRHEPESKSILDRFKRDDISSRKRESNGFDSNLPPKRIVHEPSILDRIRRDNSPNRRRESRRPDTSLSPPRRREEPSILARIRRDDSPPNRRKESRRTGTGSPPRRREEPSILDRIRRDDIPDRRRERSRSSERPSIVDRIRRDDRRRPEPIIEERSRSRDDIQGSREDRRREDNHPNGFKRIRHESPLRNESSPAKNVEEDKLPAGIKNRLYLNRPIDIEIRDRGAIAGKISPENVELFLKEIEDSVTARIFTNPTYQTKFIGHKHEFGVLTMTCADEFTSIFLQEKVKEDLPLWPGAKLETKMGANRNVIINLVIPHTIGHISEFRYMCKETDDRMATDKWRLIDCQESEDETGKLFKLGIDKLSFEFMRKQGYTVKCGDMKIKVEEEIPTTKLNRFIR